MAASIYASRIVEYLASLHFVNTSPTYLLVN